MTCHKTADARTVEVQTVAVEPVLGVAEAERRDPRPDLDGLRVKSPAGSAIFLIDGGYRRHIPNPQTYNNLFRDWEGIVVDIDIDDIPEGRSISNGAVLARPAGQSPVFLIDRGHKRHVASPAAMDKFHFSWQRVYSVPAAFLDSIPNGPTIS